DVGGADGDLIVDGCLIEFKTTVDPCDQIRKSLHQLLGYVLLDYTDRYELREVGFYLSRQRVLVQWSLEELMEMMAGGSHPELPELRARFQEIVTPLSPRSRLPSLGC